MTTLDARSGRVVIKIEGVDFTPALISYSFNQAQLGIAQPLAVTGQFVLAESSACPQVLDPLVNTTTWQIGNSVIVSVIPEAGGTATRILTGYIWTRPKYKEFGNESATLTVEFADELAFRADKTPASAVVVVDSNIEPPLDPILTTIDPLVGATREEIVDILLQAANVPSGLTGAGPDGLIYYPPQKYGDRSWVGVAAELLYAAPDDRWYLHCNSLGQAKAKSWSGFPFLSLDHTQLLSAERSPNDAYAKPVKTVTCTASVINICNESGVIAPQETFAPYNSIVGGGNTTPVLIHGIYTTQTISGNTVTIHQEIKQAFSTTVASVQTNTIQPIYSLKLSSIIDTTKVFDPVSKKIISSTTLEQRLQSGQTIQTSNSAIITESMQPFMRTTENWQYDQDYFLIAYTKVVDQPQGIVYPSVTPPAGSAAVIPTAYQSTGSYFGLVPVSSLEQTWEHTGCGDDDWTQTVRNKKACGLIDPSRNRFELCDVPPAERIPKSPPPDTETLPLGYSTSEKAIKADSVYRPQGITGYYDSYKVETIRFVDDEIVLADIADHIQKIDWGLGQARHFIAPPLNVLVGYIADGYPRPFRYVHSDGSIGVYVFSGWSLTGDTNSTLIDWDGLLLGTLRTANTSLAGNVITPSTPLPITPDTPVTFYGSTSTIYGALTPGTIYYATPTASGGFTVSATPGGSTITLTNVDPGTVTVPTQVIPPAQASVPLEPVWRLEGEFSSIVNIGAQATDLGTWTLSGYFGETGLGDTGPVWVLTGDFSTGSTIRITSFSPVTGVAGTAITINGVGLTGATGVKIGGVSATSVVVNSAGTQISAIAGTGTGSGLVEVILPSGSVFSSSAFVNSTGGSFTIQDDGVSQGTATTLNFNTGVTASVSGSVATINSTGGSFTIQDDGVSQGTATILNFDAGVFASVSGSTATITSSGTSPISPISKANLVSYWPLNESSGDANDLFGTNTLTSNNSVGSINDTILSDVFLGTNARTFDGTNQFFSLASNSGLQTGDSSFTIFGSFYFNNLSDYRFLISKDGSGTGQREYIVYYDFVISRLAFAVFRATDSSIQVNANKLGVPITARWYSIIGWHDATIDRLFIQVNNGEVDQVRTNGALQSASNGDFNIGRSQRFPVNFLLNGRANACGIAKRIWTPSERLSYFNYGVGLNYSNW